MDITNKLTSRQWALKRYLEEHFISGHYFSIEHLCENVLLPNGEKAYTLNTDPYCHDKCIALSNDVKTINWTINEGYKILVKDTKGGVKLCESEQEFIAWRDRELKPIIRKYQYLSTLKYKADRNDTMPLFNQALNERKDEKPVQVYAEPKSEEKEKEVKYYQGRLL